MYKYAAKQFVKILTGPVNDASHLNTKTKTK